MRCKPGDVARIMFSKWRQNLGLAVDVIEPLKGFPGAWKCQAREERIVTMYGAVISCALFDAHLLPITEEEQHDDLETDASRSEIRTACEATYVVPSPS